MVITKIKVAKYPLGGVVTDNAGQCLMARLILIPRWPDIASLFCFAHSVNNLVKQVLKTAYRMVMKDAASIVNILTASSAKWYTLLRQEMMTVYGTTRELKTLAQTRCNSMQGCFASLLRVRTELAKFC
jgi:hypothetical protein